MAPTPPEDDGAARRRGERLRSAIFEAVFAQLDAVGYSRLTMDGVAAEARTGKTALYRRWPNKEALVADALQDALPSPTEVAPGTSVREDLLALLTCMGEAFESKHSTAFPAIQAEPGPGTDLVRAVVRRRVSDPCRAMILAALRRGVDRGEVAPRAVTRRWPIVGPAMLIYHRLTVRPIGDRFGREVRDLDGKQPVVGEGGEVLRTELRARSSVATGVEGSFLSAYREGSFHYLLIVAERY